MDVGNYKVFFRHEENQTKCVVKNTYDVEISEGIAKKHPCDTNNKAKARSVSMTRAIETLPREDRKLIWNDYKNKCKLQ